MDLIDSNLVLISTKMQFHTKGNRQSMQIYASNDESYIDSSDKLDGHSC